MRVSEHVGVRVHGRGLKHLARVGVSWRNLMHLVIRLVVVVTVKTFGAHVWGSCRSSVGQSNFLPGRSICFQLLHSLNWESWGGELAPVYLILSRCHWWSCSCELRLVMTLRRDCLIVLDSFFAGHHIMKRNLTRRVLLQALSSLRFCNSQLIALKLCSFWPACSPLTGGLWC